MDKPSKAQQWLEGNPDAPTVLEFRVDFADGTTQSRTVQVEE